MKKESILYEKLEDDALRCKTCSHYCKFQDKQRGLCGVRENQNGKLYFLPYGRAVAAQVDPIEKKPLFHFLPGTATFSISTVGCNFRCDNCQNWNISQYPKTSSVSSREIIDSGEELLPEDIVRLARKFDCKSIAYTYTEPTIFLEYAFDTMQLARQAGLKNVWVSNGFMSSETLDIVAPYLDAINVDLKSMDDSFYRKICGARLDSVLRNCQELVKRKIWLELTTLLIPGHSDDPKILEHLASFIRNSLGDSVPWHLSVFSGRISWKMQDVPDTPLDVLKKTHAIGKKCGLKFVYPGNVPGSDLESTFCPHCGGLMIERIGYSLNRFDDQGRCGKCGADLKIVA